MPRTHKTTLRWNEYELRLVEKQAVRVGLDTSAFIRLAAVAHAAYLQGKQERSPGREIAVVAELLRQK